MKKIFGTILFVIFAKTIFAQAPGCPYIDLGPDVNVDCSSNCTTLTASILEVGATNTYSVSSITYAPPYSFNQGTTIIANIDDVFSPIINLPFNFCFFDNIYNQIVIGSNGVISFNTSNASGYCAWLFSNTIPNTGGVPYRNAISGAYHDIDPSVGGNIKYGIFNIRY